MPYHTFYSNQVENLADHLSNHLTGSLFQLEYVLVPSAPVKDYLSIYLSQKRDILSSVTFLSTQKFLDIFFQEPFPSLWELSLRIEQKILQKLPHPSPLFLPLFSYLKNDIKKIHSLSKHLGELFYLYGIFGRNLEIKWQEPSDWQEALWKEIFVEDNWRYPQRDLPKDITSFKIHLFAPFTFPKLFHQYLENLSHSSDIYLYFHTPCELFWEDIVSEKERISLKKFWKKQKAPLEKIEELDSYLSERNSLLAALGKVKKELLKSGVKEEDSLVEDFVTPPTSILGHIQADILRMERTKEPLFLPFDGSLQIHEAPSKHREIEVLYHNIISFCGKEKEPYPILILAPNIEEYVPFIHLVFQNSALPYKITHLSFSNHSSFLDGFLYLTSLINSRWEKEVFISLIENTPFQQKHHFSKEEVLTLKKWIEKSSIQWGIDKRHRASQIPTEEPLHHTWEYGFQEQIKTLFLIGSEEGSLSCTEKDLLEKFYSLFLQLKKDVQTIETNPFLPIEEGLLLIKKLIETYFYIPDETSFLQTFLIHGKKAALRLGKEKVSFFSLLEEVKNTWKQASYSFMGNLPYAIHFTSLQEGICTPAKKIHLLGMSEDFPRVERSSLLKKEVISDYLPSQNELDRALFLDSLLSSRKEFSLSFVSKTLSDGKKAPGSLLLQELMSYVQKSFTIDKPLFFSHPSFSFHKDYFSSEQPLLASSNKNFHLAKVFYEKPKTEKPKIPTINETNENTFSISDLFLASKNPIRLFCEKGLGIFVQGSPSEEDLFYSPLDRYFVQQSFLSQKTEKSIFESLHKQGLPLEKTIGTSHRSEIKKEVQALEHNQKILNLTYDELFSVTCQKFCHTAYERDKNKWIIPPLQIEVEGKTIEIVGTLKNLSLKGIFCMDESELSSWISYWPALLLSQHIPFDIPPIYLFGKDGKTKEIPQITRKTSLLSDFISFYQRCSKNAFPYTLDSYLKGKKKEKEDRFSDWLFGNFERPVPEEFLHWNPLIKKVFSPLLEKQEVHLE